MLVRCGFNECTVSNCSGILVLVERIDRGGVHMCCCDYTGVPCVGADAGFNLWFLEEL